MKKLRERNAHGALALTARQEKAIQALLAGATVQEAAKNVRVGRTTMYRWLNNVTFRAAYAAAQERAQAWMEARLRSLAAKAVQALEQILDDDNTPASVKVDAARVVLEFTLRDRETVAQPASQGAVSSRVNPPTLPPERHYSQEKRTTSEPSAAAPALPSLSAGA